MQTLRGSPDAELARHTMIDRIAALATAHDILTREQWEGAGITEVAHGVLDALAGTSGRVAIQGPALRLASQIALSLAMAFHELGTNALKYGSLSNQTGTVDLAWSAAPDGKVTITWLERGGPPVVAPERRGFGTRLLERGVAHELKADVQLDFQPEGLVCTITARLPEPESGEGWTRIGAPGP
jgi:two-component sensor histidine kinase